MKTPITYYGGKQKLVPVILPLIPKHTIYTEAFLGGGAVFFAKEKVKTEIINDMSSFVANFYSVLVSDFEKLKQKVEATPYSRVMYKVALSMYEMPHLFNSVQRAWAFFVTTGLGFSGNITGSFGCYTKGVKGMGWERKKLLLSQELIDRLKGVQIECTDALNVIRLRDSIDTFHYIDPPYFNSDMGPYGGYTEEDFGNLLSLLGTLKGKFILSSYPSDILERYTEACGWYTKVIDLTISTSHTTSGKQKPKQEVLTANFPL